MDFSRGYCYKCIHGATVRLHQFIHLVSSNCIINVQCSISPGKRKKHTSMLRTSLFVHMQSDYSITFSFLALLVFANTNTSWLWRPFLYLGRKSRTVCSYYSYNGFNEIEVTLLGLPIQLREAQSQHVFNTKHWRLLNSVDVFAYRSQTAEKIAFKVKNIHTGRGSARTILTVSITMPVALPWSVDQQCFLSCPTNTASITKFSKGLNVIIACILTMS